MGLFNKKNNEEGYIISSNVDDSRYSEWVEQARQAKKPDDLSLEELLGEITVQEDPSIDDEYVLDSADAFEGETSKSLYEKMLSFLGKKDSEEESEEEIEESNTEEIDHAQETFTENDVKETNQVIEETICEDAQVNQKPDYDPSKDEFADFFRSLEAETAPQKVVEFTQSDKDYSQVSTEDVEIKNDVDDLLSRIFGDKKSEPIKDTIAVEEVTQKQEIEKLIAKVEEETIIEPVGNIVQEETTEESVENVALEDEDIKIAADEPTAIKQEVSTENEEEIEKTRFIELPTSPTHIPKHSLYGNEHTINRKAIDAFFDNTEDPECEEENSLCELEESVTSVFDDVVDDYECLDDAARFKDTLLKKRRHLTVRMIITIVLTVLMAVINSGFMAMRGLDLGTLPNVANLVLLFITFVLNISMFTNIFKGKVDSDLCTVSVGLIVLIQSIISVFLFGADGTGLGVLAGIAYCINLVANRAICSATLKSLCVIATNEPKHAVNLIDDTEESKEIVGNIFEEEEETFLCYSKKTINVKGFMKNWARKTPNDKIAGLTLAISVALAIAITIIAFFLIPCETPTLLSIFAISFCLCMAPSMYLPYSLPTKVMVDGLKYYDSTISGFNAAIALSQCNSIVVKASDLFPSGSVILHKMNPLSANRIDSSIAKAAALTIKAESPLANIFKDIIKDQTGNLPKVEDIKYENRLGISGWVGNERVLIGNRTLLENHNVKTPSLDSERAVLSSGYYPVYLAVGGVPCLLFVVQYVADPNVKYELCRLCNTGATVVVNSTDPNITKNLICDTFDLYEDCVEMLGRNGLNKLREKTKPEESANGFASYKENTSGFLAILSSAIRIIGVKTMMQVLHIIGIIVTIAAFIVLLYTKGLILSTVLLAAIFQILFVCIISAIPYINRP